MESRCIFIQNITAFSNVIQNISQRVFVNVERPLCSILAVLSKPRYGSYLWAMIKSVLFFLVKRVLL